MTVNKLTYPAKENAVQEKINEIIDNLGTSITVDQTYDGTSANPQSGVAIEGELSTNYQTKLVSGTNIKTINSTSLLGSGDIPVLQNTATGSNALTLLGTACSVPNGINIGYGSSADRECVSIGTNATTNNLGVAIGYNTEANYSRSTALGMASKSTANGAIQIGYGTNSTANTLSIGFYNNSAIHYNWQLLDGTTGLIPDARISTNIARSSDVADTTLSNVSSINSNSAVQTALDGKVSKSGDTMTGDLTINKDSGIYIIKSSFDSTTTTAPSEFINLGALAIYDTNDNFTGYVQNSFNTGNIVRTSIGARRIINGVNKSAILYLNVDSSGNESCSFPNTTCVDGQWVVSFAEILASGTSLNGSSNLPKRIPVPNDGYVYEVLLIGRATTGTTSGNLVRLQVYTNILTSNGALICSARTRANSSVECQGTATVLVKGVASSSTNCTIDRATSFNGEGLIYMIAYRRIGTNA